MDKAKQASPLATGGAGTIMEYRFAGIAFARLLCGGTVPGLAKIDRVQLQGGPAGHNLDDVIFFGSPAKTPRIEKQVKRTVAPAPSNKEFFSVMEQCLRALDEYGADIDSGEVQLGLVATGPVGPLGQLRELTDLARAHADFATLQPILTPPVTAKSICDRYAHIKNTVALVLKNQSKALEDAELNALTHRVLKALQVQCIEAEADSRDTQIALDELAKIVPPTLKPTDNVDRKDLQEMVERCKKQKSIKYIIVDEVDRFMRAMLEIGYFLVVFKKLGVKVIFASQPNLSTDTATDTLLLMLEAFKAEGSNEERQRKSIAGLTKAVNEGKYPFVPKPGYRRGLERGVHEIHPTRGPALQKVLVRVASRQVTPSQGLIELNQSEFMQDHAPYKMDKFRKILTDCFYAGIVEIQKIVQARNEDGLHEPLITKDQHYALLKIMDAKAKNQSGPRKNGNPKYPLNNILHCDQCLDKKNNRYVGFDHGNGRNPNLVYEKYRCRACGRYGNREEIHTQIIKIFEHRPINIDAQEQLLNALNTIWKQEESQAAQNALRIKHKVKQLEEAVAIQVDGAIDPTNASIKENIMASIAKKKAEIANLTEEVERLTSNAHDDKERFLKFAFDFINNMGSRFLEIPAENRLRCKQIVFPAGFYMDANKKVYTPEISPLYSLATNKKDLSESEKSLLVRVQRL